MKKGMDAEALVCRFLQKKGYKIVSQNYTVRGGEIDIIAETKKYILFVEVKERGENSLYEAAEAVTEFKKKRIIKTAQCFLQSYPVEKQPRFDVACVGSDNDKLFITDYFENAFDASEAVL